MVHYYLDHNIDHVQAILPTHINIRRIHPGRKTVWVSLFLSFLLLMSQIFSSVNLNKPSKVSYSTFYKSLESLSAVERTPCVKNYLGRRKEVPQKSLHTCHHLDPPRGFCSLIKELFLENSSETCNHQRTIQFCRMEMGDKIKCVLPKECTSSGNIFTGIFEHQSGETIWERSLLSELETKIYSIVESKHYKGYVFIKCSDEERDYGESYSSQDSYEHSYPTQLFVYPRVLTSGLNIYKKDSFNVNMVMLDSLSRNHFFRSLPSTVRLLDELKDGSKHTLIDFQYVQSVNQRTYENLQALFAGFVNTHEKPFDTQDTPYTQLPLEVLLRKYKSKGYHTLWLEDLCWNWEWGLSKDLKVFNKSLETQDIWEGFQKALQKASIDDVGITLASCDILKVNNKNDPFRDISAVCFNGRYHHEYLLEYLQIYQQKQRRAHKPFFSFTQSNVAHDESGVRIQSLDAHLKRYLEYAQGLEDTVTILFSDHGNSYGTFLERSPEAYVETFNPFVIIIVPNALRKAIGEGRLGRMIENSQRLVTLLDLHETLMAFVNESNTERDKSFENNFVIRDGLVGDIPAHRTCHDLPLILPNLCICKDFDMIVDINEFHYAYSEFSLGVINNMILKSRFKSRQKGFGKCQLLLLKRVRSAKEVRKAADLTQYKLDVEVTRSLSPDVVDLFFFTVEVGQGAPSIRLVSFERNNLYGKYAACKDSNVDLKMCSCEEGKEEKKLDLLSLFLLPSFRSVIYSNSYNNEEFARRQIVSFLNHESTFAGTYVDKVYPKSEPCLFVIRHQYENSFNIFALNECSTIHKVTLKVASINLYLSDTFISTHLLPTLNVKHLLSGTRANSRTGWTWNYDIIIV